MSWTAGEANVTSCRFISEIITLRYPFREVLSCGRNLKVYRILFFFEQIMELTAKSRGSALADLFERQKIRGEIWQKTPNYR